MTDSNVSSTIDLPQGWILVALRELLYGIEAGKSFDCEPRPATGDEWGVIKVSAMTWGQFDEHENKAVPPGKQFNPTKEIRQDDLLISRSNTAELVGASVLVGRCRPHLLLSDKSMRLKYAPSICAAWLHGALSSPHSREQMSLLATGTSDSMRNISQEKLSGIVLRLPPAPEQQRIVDEVDEILSDLDAGVVALERVREKLKLYRASVLKAGVEGTLTAEWRAAHPHPEPASELLQRILAERRRHWEEDQLAKFKVKGHEPPENWKAKYNEPAAPNTTNFPPLPEGWCWASFDQIGNIQGGLQKSPTRAPRKNHYPYVRVANVLRGSLDLSELHRFELTTEELNRLRLEHGDILIVEGNGSRSEIGRCARWQGEIQNCVHQNHIIRVRPFAGLLPKYVDAFLNSPTGQQAIQLVASSTSGLYTLSIGKIEKLPLALAPSVEQEVIVEAIEDQLSVIDHLEADLDAKLKTAQGLRQAILRNAFTGQLVSQDPNDEPASELLRRIAAERAGRGAPIRRRRRAAS